MSVSAASDAVVEASAVLPLWVPAGVLVLAFVIFWVAAGWSERRRKAAGEESLLEWLERLEPRKDYKPGLWDYSGV